MQMQIRIDQTDSHDIDRGTGEMSREEMEIEFYKMCRGTYLI
jgi:hypothetical protein